MSGGGCLSSCFHPCEQWKLHAVEQYVASPQLTHSDGRRHRAKQMDIAEEADRIAQVEATSLQHEMLHQEFKLIVYVKYTYC